MKTHPLPVPPDLKVAVSAAKYQSARNTFEKLFSAYFKKMSQQSLQQTDEVGSKRSTFKRTGKCFAHASR